MQVNLHKKTIDQYLCSALEKGGTNESVFRWYLAMQVNNVIHYHPEKQNECEGFLPYPSINLPSAPRSNFYAQEKDYQEYHKQHDGLSKCMDPAANIRFMNYLKPQCLNYSRHEQLIAVEIIENSPFYTQQIYGANPLHRQNSKENFDVNQSSIDEACDTNADMPANLFVDATLNNTKSSVNMTF